jgi:hypothetical protein
MKQSLALAGLAVLIAAPALAQSAHPVVPANPYAQQLAQLQAEEKALPGGGDERIRADVLWQEMVTRAEAYRHGMPIPERPAAAQATFPASHS